MWLPRYTCCLSPCVSCDYVDSCWPATICEQKYQKASSTNLCNTQRTLTLCLFLYPSSLLLPGWRYEAWSSIPHPKDDRVGLEGTRFPKDFMVPGYCASSALPTSGFLHGRQILFCHNYLQAKPNSAQSMSLAVILSSPAQISTGAGSRLTAGQMCGQQTEGHSSGLAGSFHLYLWVS